MGWCLLALHPNVPLTPSLKPSVLMSPRDAFKVVAFLTTLRLRVRQHKIRLQNLKASPYVLSMHVLRGNVVGEVSGDGGVIHLSE